MSTERAWFRGGVVALIWRPDNDTYLFLRRSRQKSYAAGKWWPVTGTVEVGEGFEGALRREVTEELGAKVRQVTILETTYFDRDGENWLSVSFLCTLENPDHLVLNAEHDEYQWISPNLVEKTVANEQYSTGWIMTALNLAEQRKKNLAAK